MEKKWSLSGENFYLHGENARLRKKIESFEQELQLPKIIALHEKEIHKHVLKEQQLERERDRYHDLWQRALKKNAGYSFEQLILNEDLTRENAAMREKITLTELQLQDALDQNLKLKAQMNRDYENSSIPSSQKPFHKKIKNSRVQTDRKPGAQLGHAGHRRPHMEPTRPVIIIPTPQEILDNPDYFLTGKMIIKQVADLEIRVSVTEYQTPEYRSISTGKRSHAPFPNGIINEFSYGDNAQALAFLLNNYGNVSIDKTQELIEGLSDGKIILSKGMISTLSKKFSDATKHERSIIYSRLLMAPAIYSDATTGKVNGKTVQIILCANEDEMLYFFRKHKGHEGLKDTPVAEYQQTLIHDHDKTYYHYGSDHQECLAHVLRYLQDSIDNESQLSWNKQMKGFLSATIHQIKGNRNGLSEEIISGIEHQYDAILKSGEQEYLKHPPNKYYLDGQNLLKRMILYRNNHLLFLHHPEIDYTNNLSERALRKFKRKLRQVVTFRSNTSVENLCNCISILETRRLQGTNIYKTSREAFSLK